MSRHRLLDTLVTPEQARQARQILFELSLATHADLDRLEEGLCAVLLWAQDSPEG